MFDGFFSRYADGESLPRIVTSSEDVRIAIVGVGGGGCNTVNRIYQKGIKTAKTIAINTDKLTLDTINADHKLLIGESITRGLGAGGFPEIGQKSANVSKQQIQEALQGFDIIFLCTGMGGGTGTGASFEIAKIAREMGSTVIGVVTFPFKHEGGMRIKRAQWGIKNLLNEAHTVIVIDNNKLATYAKNLPIDQAFALADGITANALKSITDTVMLPSLMNIDYADLRSVMENGGMAMISIGEAKAGDVGMAEDIVKDTLQNPLLDIDSETAKGALIHIEGGQKLTLGETIQIGTGLTEKFPDNADVKIGARINPAMEDTVRATAIITGIKCKYVIGEKEEQYQTQKSQNFMHNF